MERVKVGDSSDNDCGWFYTKKVPCFLEVNENMNRKIKDEKLVKNESSIIPHNSTEIKANTEVEENYLIDQYDEETVLLQIPQDDTRVEDVVKEFKNQNKLADTIASLRDKGDIIKLRHESALSRLSFIMPTILKDPWLKLNYKRFTTFH